MTFEQIRGWFPEDYGGPTHEAARRKFERDKDDLIELGVPLKYEEPVEGEGESAGGYRIDRASYYLRDLELTRDELALLYLSGAAVLEQDVFPYRRDLELALAKIALQAGVDRSSTASAFQQILVRHPATRTTPELRERLDQLEHAATTRKRVRILYETSYRKATSERPEEQLERRPDGSVVARVDFSHVEGLVAWVLGFGAGAELLEPADARAAIAEACRAALRALPPDAA